MSEPTRHLPPFHCPYCGEEDIRPYGEQASTFRCAACKRVWKLSYVGLAPSAVPDAEVTS